MNPDLQNVLVAVKGILDLFGLTIYVTAFAVIALVTVVINTFFHK